MDILRCDFSRDDDTLTATPVGSLDHHSAKEARVALEDEIIDSGCTKLVLDLSRVDFMDSAGIGLILGRLNTMNALGGEMVIRNPGEAISKLLTLSGIDRYVSEEVTSDGVPDKENRETEITNGGRV